MPHVKPSRPWYGYEHQQARARLLADGPPCCVPDCAEPATIADHQPPIRLHYHVRGTDCCELMPMCATHSALQGSAIGRAVRRGLVPTPTLPAPSAPRDAEEGIPASDPCWRVPWLTGLRRVPKGCRWPNLMSAPHPAAVGSYGPLVERSAAAYGVTFRWWQRLALRRLLEHDRHGELCWDEAILSTPRRAGKSIALRELMWWRISDEAAALFGEEQNVLHTSRTLTTTAEIASEAQQRAGQVGFRVVRTTGRELIGNGLNEWWLRSEEAAYGLGPSCAVCDEAWDYKPETVVEGIQPSLMERKSPQLLLASTAHRKATELIPDRRASAIADLRSTEPLRLLIEWSSPADRNDLIGSAMAASPIWDRQRERHVRKALADALAARRTPGDIDPVDMFASQYCNDWRAGHTLGREQGEPVIDFDEWTMHGGHELGPTAVLAVEDYYGKQWGVAWCSLVEDDAGVRHITVAGQILADRAALSGLLADLAPADVLAGASVADDPVFADYVVVPVHAAQTPGALATLRRAVGEGRVVHDSSPDLDEQMRSVRVVEQLSGLRPAPGRRTDVLRCAAWAVTMAEQTITGPGVY